MSMSSRNNNLMLMLSSIVPLLLTSVNGFKTGVQAQHKPSPVLKEAPMAFKWPIVGTLPDLYARGGIDGLCQVHESMYRDYGNVYGMSLMGDDELFVCDPRVFDTVLRKEGKFPIGGAESVTTFVEYYAENNLTLASKSISRGPDWKEWRQATTPDMLVLWETYLPTIADAASKISQSAAGLEARIDTGQNKNQNKNKMGFVDFISRAAFDMFSAVLYGESPQTTNSDIASPQDVEFVEATQNAFDITGKLITNPLEKVFGSELYKEFVVNMDKTFEFGNLRTKSYVDQAIKEQQQQQQVVVEEEKITTAAAEPDDISEPSSKCPIQTIKTAAASGLDKNPFGKTNIQNPSYIKRLVNRGELSAAEISEVGAPLLMAGVDTTAYVLSWLYLNLASNPTVQTNLAHELRTVLKGDDVTTSEQLNALPYLKACVRESHRLTPPAPMSVKKLEQDIDVVVNGKNTATAYHVKAGQRISLNIRAFPMDPEYVTDPTHYQPERFLPDAIAARKGTPSEIIDHPSFADPFGRGKRRCLGGNIAIAEIMVLTARLLQDWEILFVDPNSANKWKPKQKLLLKADPYPAMKLVSRTVQN